MKTFQSPGKDEIKEVPPAANVPAAGNPIVPFDEEVIKSLILSTLFGSYFLQLSFIYCPDERMHSEAEGGKPGRHTTHCEVNGVH